MTVGAPLPRSGRLLGGGNSLELLWATLAALAAAVVALVAGLVWTAVAVEAAIAGTTWTLAPADVIGLLPALAVGDVPVGQPDAHGVFQRIAKMVFQPGVEFGVAGHVDNHAGCLRGNALQCLVAGDRVAELQALDKAEVARAPRPKSVRNEKV